jgi:hypothetical protein
MANLSGADLSEAELSGAKLSGADLGGADLIAADLSEAGLGDADASPAELKGADLSDAYLAGANLRYARGVTKETLEKQTGSLEALRGATMPTDQYISYEFEPAFTFEIGDDWESMPPETTDAVWIQTGPEGRQLLFTNPSHVFDFFSLKEVAAPQTVKEWVSWFQRHPKLVTSKPAPVSVGGASGMRIDVTASSPENYHLCGGQPCVPLYPSGAILRCLAEQGKLCKDAIASNEVWMDRFIIVEVGGETVLIDVAAPADQFDEFLPKAQKVLDTVEWRGG